MKGDGFQTANDLGMLADVGESYYLITHGSDQCSWHIEPCGMQISYAIYSFPFRNTTDNILLLYLAFPLKGALAVVLLNLYALDYGAEGL